MYIPVCDGCKKRDVARYASSEGTVLTPMDWLILYGQDADIEVLLCGECAKPFAEHMEAGLGPLGKAEDKEEDNA